ncbi:unnamed protein product [Durusdinium trenchii]|uniref:Alpha-ketoglutarate-dependent dioxygenase alkB homolog 3 (Alkylated DNA repair protein alkB homolog 3) (MAbh3) n=2 Tax=Durusdinium trenchii TaxID=1381693 RepID=A0ABP0S536_9DINO
MRHPYGQPRCTLADAIAQLKAARARCLAVQEENLAKRLKIDESERSLPDVAGPDGGPSVKSEKKDPTERLWKHEEPPPAKLAGKDWEESRTQKELKLIGETTDDPWTYFLKDESRRSFAGHLANPFGKALCASWFAKVRVGTKWMQPATRWGPMPRKTAWMVAANFNCTYEYGGMTVQPTPYPVWMIQLMQEVMPHCGLKELSEFPNSCNLNLYEDNTQMVGWHADDEELFQGKFQDCRIISLSLGATRRFELELNWPEENECLGASQQLADGDLCTMEGMTQKHYMHRVPEEDVPLQTVLAGKDELPLSDGPQIRWLNPACRCLRGGELETAVDENPSEDRGQSSVRLRPVLWGLFRPKPRAKRRTPKSVFGSL